MPLLSIIIPTYNSGATLEPCLASLRGQTWRDFETLIIDGGSEDNTVDIAQQHIGATGRGLLVCEPDKGIYDAINKGVQRACGEWVYILGSDDELHDEGMLQAFAPLLNDDSDLVYGKVFRTSAGQFQGREMSFVDICLANICQQGIFYRRSLIQSHGGFDLRYRLCADWALNIKSFATAHCLYVDRVVATYAGDGRSSTSTDFSFYRDRLDLVCEALGGSLGSHKLGPFRYLLLEKAQMEMAAGQLRRAARYFFWFGFHTIQEHLGLRPQRAGGAAHG